MDRCRTLKARCRTDWTDGGLRHTDMTPRASLQSDAYNV